MLDKHEDLTWILRSNLKGQAWCYILTRPALGGKDKFISRAHQSASLLTSLGFRFSGRPYLKNKGGEQLRKTPNSLISGPHTRMHAHKHLCLCKLIPTPIAHTYTTLTHNITHIQACEPACLHIHCNTQKHTLTTQKRE